MNIQQTVMHSYTHTYIPSNLIHLSWTCTPPRGGTPAAAGKQHRLGASCHGWQTILTVLAQLPHFIYTSVVQYCLVCHQVSKHWCQQTLMSANTDVSSQHQSLKFSVHNSISTLKTAHAHTQTPHPAHTDHHHLAAIIN